MFKKLITFFIFATLAFADFKALSTTEVKDIVEKKSMPIIDIRRLEEWTSTGIIKNSHTITFFDNKGKYDAKLWLEQLNNIVKSPKDPFILVCAHANRTKVVGKFLSKIGYEKVYELEGGINYGWRDKKEKTVPFN